jgi:hypothetical protein
MSHTSIPPSPDDVPEVDVAEAGQAHPHTSGFEQADATASTETDTEFGEDPDVETHSAEGLGAVNPGV